MGILKAYLELARPFTLIAPITGLFSGAIIASGINFNIYYLMGAFSVVLLNAASNANNQFFDLEVDKINKPLRPLPSARISKKKTMIFALTLYSGALILSWSVNLRFFLIVSVTAVISFLYSATPFRIKSHPFLSNIFIALPRGMLLIVAGWSMSKPVSNIEPWFIGSIFTLYLLGAATTKDFSDMEGDRRLGINTLPVLYGPEKAAKMISPFLYAPFMLIPLGVFANIIRVTALPLTLLAIWGIYTANLIAKSPRELTLEKNHLSWKHMYFMLITGQLGFAAAYLIKT